MFRIDMNVVGSSTLSRSAHPLLMAEAFFLVKTPFIWVAEQGLLDSTLRARQLRLAQD